MDNERVGFLTSLREAPDYDDPDRGGTEQRSGAYGAPQEAWETRDPVFMLDEIDKIGADWRGDPSSALLEVLDPAQNHTFVDNYLAVSFDLSQVLFIATANTLDTIPGPLRDRMEILMLSGYTDEEKIGIAREYLIPKVLAAHGLATDELSFEPEAIRQMVRGTPARPA